MFIIYFTVYAIINLCNFAYIYTRPATTRVRALRPVTCHDPLCLKSFP
jgi:hypothetical protein